MDDQNTITEPFDSDAFVSAFNDIEPETPQATEESQGSEGPQASEEPEGPEAPQASEESQGSEEPDKEEIPENPAQPEDVITLDVGLDKPLTLPRSAVAQLRSALGSDPLEIIRKGMGYDQKAARELFLLDTYADASGMTREQYLDALEKSVEDRRLETEMELARREFPDTPDDALAVIAQQRREAKAAFERQKADEKAKEIQAGRERINNIIAESRRTAARNAWAEYEKISGAHKAEDVPQRVLDLVKEGMAPVAAYWRHQAEQAQEQAAIRKKERENKNKSVGSLSGIAEQGSDPFLRGFYDA